jgi:hypothetical protein
VIRAISVLDTAEDVAASAGLVIADTDDEDTSEGTETARTSRMVAGYHLTPP